MKTNAFALAFVSEKNVRDLPSRSFTTIVVEAALMNPRLMPNKTQIVNRVIAFVFRRIIEAV